MLSDLGTPQVTVGQQPVVDQVEVDDSDVIAQPRPHRDDPKSKEQDQGGGLPPKPPPRQAVSAGEMPAPATAYGRGQAQPKPTEAQLQAELARRETQAFEQAALQIREAVGSDPQLAELARQLAVDMTPEGLRIQLRDADREPMFAFGSAVPNDKARLLIQKVAPVLARMTQDISIAGHTDAAPFAGAGRSN
jgi:chemotaxis protein MotB